MRYFIKQVVGEVNKIDWAGHTSDNLNEQLMNWEQTRKFDMSSYVIYMLTLLMKYDGLRCKGPIGSGNLHLNVHECYPQLYLPFKDDHV